MGKGRITGAELAAELGVSVGTVLNDAIAVGLATRGGPYTPAQAAAIRAARRERSGRITQRALAAELGVDPAMVSRRAGRLGFGGGRGYTPEQAAALRALLRERQPRVATADLAAELRVNRSTVANHARRLGLGTAGGYTPEQAGAIRASIAASRPIAARRRNGTGAYIRPRDGACQD